MNATPEMIDILDNTGAKTGRVATRDDIHRLGLGHKIAAVAVIDNKNRILLQQRSMNKLTNPGKWDITAAGHVDAGEDTFTTALRETAEEVGLKVGGGDAFSDELLGCFDLQLARRANDRSAIL